MSEDAQSPNEGEPDMLDHREVVDGLLKSGDFDLDRISALEQKVSQLLSEMASQRENIIELERGVEIVLGMKPMAIRKALWLKDRMK